jgi:hypothetical protein
MINFKLWLEINDPFQNLEDIEIYKSGDGAYKHDFEVNGIPYIVELKPTTMEHKYKPIVPFAKFLDPNDSLSGYSVNLIGGGQTQLTGKGEEYASRIYANMIKTIAKIQNMQDAPPMDFITYWPQHPKMNLVYDKLRKRFLKDYKVAGNNLLVKNDVLNKLQNPDVEQHVDQETQTHNLNIDKIKANKNKKN